MFPAAYVDDQLTGWLASGLLKSEVIAKLAKACIGWPYVFGAVGEQCTPAVREKYIKNYATRNPDESAQIKKTCYVKSGKRSNCSGCPYYPNGPTRCFDCRGFTRWAFGKVGITISGGGATSQWNDNGNWSQKGLIQDMPPDVVCCVFMANGKKMSHTGIHIGGGIIIHCSGTVKQGMATDRGWTHYAIPKGMDGSAPSPDPAASKPTLRKGSRGDYVTLLQVTLIQMGYSCGSTGADGIFGNDTLYAVRKFQLDNGLQMDGVVGPATWEALMNPTEIKTYTVHIPKQPKYAADALVKQYQDAWMEEE